MKVHGWLWSAPAASSLSLSLSLCERIPQLSGARSGPGLAGRLQLYSALCRAGVENRGIHSPKGRSERHPQISDRPHDSSQRPDPDDIGALPKAKGRADGGTGTRHGLRRDGG